jgi:hypothetical protein
MAKLYRKGYEDSAKPYGYTDNWYGGAWIIGAWHPDNNFFLVRKGDFGSICVFDPVNAGDSLVGSWLGLLWGCTATGQGIMASMDQSIEDVTQIRVTLPRKAGTLYYIRCMNCFLTSFRAGHMMKSMSRLSRK